MRRFLRRARRLPDWFYVLSGLSLAILLCSWAEWAVLGPNRKAEERDRRRQEDRRQLILHGDSWSDQGRTPRPERGILDSGAWRKEIDLGREILKGDH